MWRMTILNAASVMGHCQSTTKDDILHNYCHITVVIYVIRLSNLCHWFEVLNMISKTRLRPTKAWKGRHRFRSRKNDRSTHLPYDPSTFLTWWLEAMFKVFIDGLREESYQ